MRIEQALEVIEELSADELRGLTKHEIMFIVSDMNAEEKSRFFMEKNVKVFGGIQGYVEDFLQKVNPHSLNMAGKYAVRAMLNNMLKYPGVNGETEKLIKDAIKAISNEAAPAAGGGRKKTRRKLKRTRVRR